MRYKKLLSEKSLNLFDHFENKTYTLKDFIRQINLNTTKLKKIESLLHGIFRSHVQGPGFDFNEIREYRTGDDLRHISWKATARTGTLQTKEYYAEREIRTYFLIDISNSMFCGNKLETFITLIAFLLNLSCNISEKIGCVLFSEDIKYHFPQNESNLQSNLIFEVICNLATNINNSNSTNLSKTLEFTNRYFNKKGLLFLISDFLNLYNWEKTLFSTAQKQNIYSFQIYDPLDFSLPRSGYITIIDPETKQRSLVNTDNKKIQEAYKLLAGNKQEQLNNFLKNAGIHHSVIEKNDFN